MIARRTLGAALAGIAALAAVTTVAPSPAQAADDWRKQVPVFRVGILGGENEADRLKNYACFKDIMSERLGIPVELYPASDYAGRSEEHTSELQSLMRISYAVFCL